MSSWNWKPVRWAWTAWRRSGEERRDALVDPSQLVPRDQDLERIGGLDRLRPLLVQGLHVPGGGAPERPHRLADGRPVDVGRGELDHDAARDLLPEVEADLLRDVLADREGVAAQAELPAQPRDDRDDQPVVLPEQRLEPGGRVLPGRLRPDHAQGRDVRHGSRVWPGDGRNGRRRSSQLHGSPMLSTKTAWPRA